jgi:hypothetical protein
MERRKPPRKPQNPIMGGIAKNFPEIYEQFKEKAEELGLETDEAMMEAFETWYFAKVLKNVDPGSFVTGYNFAYKQLATTINFLNSLGNLWVSGFLKEQAELLEQLNRYRAEIYKQARVEAEEILRLRQQEQQQTTQDIKTTILKMLLDFVLSKISPKTALKPKVEVEVE